jgi:hypothetical protein
MQQNNRSNPILMMIPFAVPELCPLIKGILPNQNSRLPGDNLSLVYTVHLFLL